MTHKYEEQIRKIIATAEAAGTNKFIEESGAERTYLSIFEEYKNETENEESSWDEFLNGLSDLRPLVNDFALYVYYGYEEPADEEDVTWMYAVDLYEPILRKKEDIDELVLSSQLSSLFWIVLLPNSVEAFEAALLPLLNDIGLELQPTAPAQTK